MNAVTKMGVRFGQGVPGRDGGAQGLLKAKGTCSGAGVVIYVMWPPRDGRDGAFMPLRTAECDQIATPYDCYQHLRSCLFMELESDQPMARFPHRFPMRSEKVGRSLTVPLNDS